MPIILLEAMLPSRVESTARKAKKAALKLANKSKGFLGKLVSFGGFAFSALLKVLPPMNWASLWDGVVNAYFTLKYFDWNATDKSLSDQIDSNNKAIATAAASALGTTLGWSVMRLGNMWLGRFGSGSQKAAASAQSIKIPVLSARIGAALAEEGNEEIRAGVYNFLSTARRALISNSLISGVLMARRNQWLGMTSVTEAQADGSIAAKIEKEIEKLPEFWRQPAEEMIESFEEAILEAGYVITYQIDDHVAAQKQALLAEVTRTVQVEIEDSDEILEFSGPQSLVKQATINALATRDLLAGRDVGQILGSPVNDEEWNPKLQLRQLQITYSSRSKPPLWVEPRPRDRNYSSKPGEKENKQKRARRAEITIPDCKPGLAWAEIKKAAGHYQRGNHRVSMMLDSGREMQVWASTPAEGREVLMRLAGLSTSKPLVGTTKAEEILDLPANRKKPIEKMYPAFCTLLFRKNKGTKGQIEQQGLPAPDVLQKIDLWPEDKPEDFKPLA